MRAVCSRCTLHRAGVGLYGQTLAAVIRFMPEARLWWQSLVNLLAGVGLLIIGAGAWALRLPELRWALGRR